MSYLDTPTAIEAAIRQRDALGHALGDLLKAMGIIREGASMTGPELLYQAEMVADHERSKRATNKDT